MGRTSIKAELQKLPFRAILALVLRCARRLTIFLYCGKEGGEQKQKIFEAAGSAAEIYANGPMNTPDISSEAFNLPRQYSDTSVLTVAAFVAQAAVQAVGVGIFQGPVLTENPFFGESIEASMAEVMLKSANDAMQFYSLSIPETGGKFSQDPSWIDYEVLHLANFGLFPPPGKTMVLLKKVPSALCVPRENLT